MTYNTCFSGECGICTSCCGDISKKCLGYLSGLELYKLSTGKEAPPPPPPVKNTRKLYLDMLLISEEYRNSYKVKKWAEFSRLIKSWEKTKRLYMPGGIQDDITNSMIESLKLCKEEGVIYGENRSLKPSSDFINDMIFLGKVDLDDIAGKIAISGGGLFDIDVCKKQKNLKNEDYEEYFEKFNIYLERTTDEMRKYGATSFSHISQMGKIPRSFNVNGEVYTYTDDPRVVCDNEDCNVMNHCMINWDRENNYTGEKNPKHNSLYYSKLISYIPKYTKNMRHELCLLCAKSLSNSV